MLGSTGCAKGVTMTYDASLKKYLMCPSQRPPNFRFADHPGKARTKFNQYKRVLITDLSGSQNCFSDTFIDAVCQIILFSN
jgi:hypothetical protein